MTFPEHYATGKNLVLVLFSGKFLNPQHPIEVHTPKQAVLMSESQPVRLELSWGALRRGHAGTAALARRAAQPLITQLSGIIGFIILA